MPPAADDKTARRRRPAADHPVTGRRRVPARVQYRWRCHTCGELLMSWAGAERHADSHGGARLDCCPGLP
jgi:hypothetical protein